MTKKRKPVHYRLSWDEPNDHLYQIEIRFEAGRGGAELWLPSWRPGRYLIQNYAANVRQFEATDPRGRALPWRKTAKSRWAVDAPAGQKVVVRYRYYAGTLDAGSSFLSADEAYFNGSNLFMCVEGRRGDPAELAMELPPRWKIATQLASKGDGVWAARDYDALIDSPVIASPTLKVHSFSVSGCRVSLAFQNHEGVATEPFVEPTKRIVRNHIERFGGPPADRYVFLIHVGDRWHGVEHEDSCSIIVNRSELLSGDTESAGFDHALAIISHEFFHLWNVKRILPARFVPYDYSVETPTGLLWAMEGVTSYYGERAIRDARVWSAEKYLDHLAEEISIFESTPGKDFVTLSGSSWDAWLAEPAQMHDRANAFVSFYNKGEIFATLLDLTIRKGSRGARSLDDVMRDLWTRYGAKGRGLEEDAVLRAASRVARRDLSELFARFVDGLDPFPYEEMFADFGIVVERSAARDGALSFGAKFKARDGGLFVESVRTGSPAMRAGLLGGDELVAVSGTRIRSEAILDRVIEGSGGAALDVVYSRNDVLRETRVTPASDAGVVVKLKFAEDPQPKQRALRDGWIGEG